MLTNERLGVFEGACKHVNVAFVSYVTEYHRRIALQSAQLRALHRAPLERLGELLRRHCQHLTRERPRILPRQHAARRELRHLVLPRELHVPRTDVLGGVPVSPFCDPACDRRPNPQEDNDLASRKAPRRPSRTATSAAPSSSRSGRRGTASSQATRQSSRERCSPSRASRHRRAASSAAPTPWGTTEQKMAELQEDVESNRPLSTSLAFDA
jgi:hypothetical protein